MGIIHLENKIMNILRSISITILNEQGDVCVLCVRKVAAKRVGMAARGCDRPCREASVDSTR